MPIHSIILLSSDGAVNERAAKLIRESYPTPQHYKLDDTAYLVRASDLTTEVAAKVGMSGGGGQSELATGVVFTLTGTYWGFAAQSLWEWLQMEELA